LYEITTGGNFGELIFVMSCKPTTNTPHPFPIP
jgi:hypothetical protein